jgi:hypothetical protein
MYGSYDENRLEELMLVAAFHDIGKLDTTKRHSKNGHLVSYGHAEKSQQYFDAIADFVCPGGVRKNVVSFLIKNHMKIKFKDNMNPNKLHNMKAEAQDLGSDVWQMLNEFNVCDDMLSFFSRHGMEHYEVDDASDEVDVFERHEEAIGRFQDYVDTLVDRIDSRSATGNKDLWLIRGVPGSGKTAVAEKMTSSRGEMIAADDFFIENGTYNFDPSKLGRAHAWCKHRTEEEMKDGKATICIHNTFTQPWEMVEYYALAAKHGYMVFSIVVENRHGGESEHGVPQNAINKMKNRFQTRL